MSNTINPTTISSASPTHHEPKVSKGNCEVRVTSGEKSSSYEALHANAGRAQFTKLVELKFDGKSGVQKYWMSSDNFAQFNIQRLRPSTITVSK